MGNLIASKPEKPQETPKVENVGEAFMSWAEQYWALEKVITKGMTNEDNNELCPYNYTRQIFINKINELAKNNMLSSQPML
jgi:hypothetical protein